MSYREENDQVILTMSREDYDQVLKVFAGATAAVFPNTMWILKLLNRLNEGNPNYTPYQVAPPK